ncbi:MAG: hypothetical protein MJZ01_04860 [Bacteroidales bacterium]|nr:hypothetical protein [Bacteroidales bacterium]
MKNKIILSLSALLMLVGMTSCDDDEKMSCNLSGEWHGYFGSYYVTNDRHGDEHVFYADETYMRFTPDYPFATHGYGVEVDYYDRGPYEYKYFSFDWRVEDERLILRYPHDRDMNVVIDDYRMNTNRFSGYIGEDDFCLHRVDCEYDWNSYDCDYGCCRRSYWDW